MLYLTDLTCKIVTAYVSKNAVRRLDLLDLIRETHLVINGLADRPAQGEPADFYVSPTAAEIRRSVTPDGIVSFLNGKTYKTIKRHLQAYGMDRQSYCVRFGLPADYPIVSRAYAAQRSKIAKSIGLGQIRSRVKDTQL